MAKLKAPAVSFGARGAIAKTLVMSEWKGRPYVREYQVPHNPRTEKQVQHRVLFKQIVDEFKALSDEEKKALKVEANKEQITALNVYMKQRMKALKDAA